jgi:hypothetical protein
MTSLITKVGAVFLLALGGLSATAPLAAAAGPNDVITIQYHDRDWGPGPGPRPDWDRGPPPPPRGCSPRFAEDKAYRMGMNRPRVIEANRRVVIVGGFDRRGRDRIVFANERGCPVLR